MAVFGQLSFLSDKNQIFSICYGIFAKRACIITTECCAPLTSLVGLDYVAAQPFHSQDMPLSDEQVRKEAWDNVVHTEGTRAVFSKRATRLRRLTRFRDFLGLLVPLCVAYVLTADWLSTLDAYRTLAVSTLGGVAALQAIIVLWSLLARWDEELAYDIRAARDSYELSQEWRRLAKGDATDWSADYTLLKRRQAALDSHDTEKGISDREKMFGMRSGLIECQRPCLCGEVPRDRRLPFWRTKCAVCGGN